MSLENLEYIFKPKHNQLHNKVCKMNDKEFLDKIKTAYQAYPYPNKDIESFISWLYKQYGYVEKKDKK